MSIYWNLDWSEPLLAVAAKSWSKGGSIAKFKGKELILLGIYRIVLLDFPNVYGDNDYGDRKSSK